MFTPNQITPFASIMHEVNKALGETVKSNTLLKRFPKNEIKTIILESYDQIFISFCY